MIPIDRSLVKDMPFLAGLDPASLEDVLSQARSARYPRDTAIFRQGGPAESFFLLLHGHVRASKAGPSGDQIVVRYFVSGEVFGIAPAIGVTHYPATATAVDDSVVLLWPSAAWPTLTARYPSLAMSTMQTLGTRLQETHARVLELSTEQVERRVARAVLRLTQRAGRKVEQGVKIDFPISRQDIAEMTGTTLHTVSRTLSAWEQQGLVKAGRQSVVLLDPTGLLRLAERGTADQK